MGPPIDAFADHAPHVATEFRKLYATIGAMHSFVHGGAQAVVHVMQPLLTTTLASSLRNRNLLQAYLANCAVVTT